MIKKEDIKLERFMVASRKRRRASLIRRRRRNKPGLQATILAALISQFQWSGYSDTILEEPETIRKALLALYENEEIWAELNSLSLTVQHLMKLKEKL